MNAKKILGASMLLAAGVVIGLLLRDGTASYEAATAPTHAVHDAAGQPEHEAAGAAVAPGTGGERKVLFWYDPMYPGTKFDKPGKSPFMDMDLVPRYADDAAGEGVRIDPALVQNLAVRTTPVRVGRLEFVRDVPGSVEFNDYRFAKVQSRTDGFVEQTYSLAVGDNVREGQPLVDITVPGWASDQSEYLLLKQNKAAPKLLNGVRERLRLAGMPEELLQKVDETRRVQTRLVINAPIDGVLTTFDVYKDMNVNTNLTLASIQGVDPIWVTADVPESLLHLVSGQKRIRVEVPAYPDLVFYAESFTLLPKGDAGTRTIPLRLSLRNVEGALRPGMSARIRLRGKGEKALLIPTQALIDLGTEQRVIVRAQNGNFVPRRVQVLRASREETALASGVEPGDQVVTSGLFLIDSEANLSGALDRMRGTGALESSPPSAFNAVPESGQNTSAPPEANPTAKTAGQDHAGHIPQAMLQNTPRLAQPKAGTSPKKDAGQAGPAAPAKEAEDMLVKQKTGTPAHQEEGIPAQQQGGAQ